VISLFIYNKPQNNVKHVIVVVSNVTDQVVIALNADKILINIDTFYNQIQIIVFRKVARINISKSRTIPVNNAQVDLEIG
jgi:hypothetical protein